MKKVEHSGSVTGYFYTDETGGINTPQPNYNLWTTKVLSSLFKKVGQLIERNEK
jgi:hypothetical protein